MPDGFWHAAIAALAAYAVGSLSPSYILARAIKGVDIRRMGTLNAGALNAFNALGTWGGILVFALDIGKGALAVVIPRYVLDWPDAAVYTSALAVVVGHNWPVWMGFVGGKGVATSSGVAVALVPLLAIAALVPAIVLLVTLKRWAIAGMGAGFVLLVALTFIFRRDEPGDIVVILAMSALVGLAQLTRPTWVRPEDMPPPDAGSPPDAAPGG